MQTRVLAASDEAVREAAALLARGEIVAFPTETVYGLGARADSAEAVRRVFAAKGRPADKPLIVHVRDAAQAQQFAAAWPDAAERLARAFWPGPLTLVLPSRASVPAEVTAGGNTVAVRAPAHPVSRALLAACDFALAAPSANVSGAAPPVDAAAVVAGLSGRIPLVLDGGPCPLGQPSTIVDLVPLIAGGAATILRPGALAVEAIAEIVGRLDVAAHSP